MLDRLIDIIVQIWDVLVPFITIHDYERGVVLRNGKFRKVLEPGLYGKIPYFDTVLTHHVAITTIGLQPQSVITKDGKNIVVRAIVKYKIVDVHNYLVLVNDAKDAMADTTMGIIKETINERDWEEVQKGKIDSLITRRVIAATKEYGIEVEKLL